MSFDVLSPMTKMQGRCLLEASAGTGKTFALQHIAVRLLLEERLSLDQILLVTFTNASTRELRSRIRKNIEEVLSAYRQDLPLYPYMELCPPQEAIFLLENALYLFDEAPIYTIHGFCHQLLQDHAFSLGMPLSLPLVEDSARVRKRKQFFRESLYSLDPDRLHPLELRWVFQEKKSFDAVYQSLEKGREKRRSVPLKSVYEMFLEKAPYFASFVQERPSLEMLFQEAYPYYRKEKRAFSSLLEEVAYFHDFLRGTLTWERFVLWMDQKAGLLRHFSPENRKKRGARASAFWEEVSSLASQHLLPLVATARSVKRILGNIQSEVQEPFASFLLEEQDISPDDLLEQAAALLGHPKCLEKVRSSYLAIMIDEFQDTDQLQWEIFHALFFQSARAFYLVGDPKQSIYGFRNADIYTYLEASASMDRHYVLDTNYRSDRTIVEGLNRFFSYKKEWLFLPKTGDALAYSPVHYAKEATEGAPELRFWLSYAESKRGKGHIKEAEEQSLYPEIARVLVRFQKERPGKTAAILVKDRFQGERVRDFLCNRGFSCAMKSSLPLQELPLFAAFHDLFQAIASPLDEKAFRKALFTSFCGYFFHTIQAASEVELESLRTRFFQWQEVLEKQGFGCFWSLFCREHFQGKSVRKRLYDRGEYIDALRIVEHVAEVAQTCPFSLAAFDLFWKRVEQAPPFVPAADEEAVQIMTIHASKGLEFDLVVPLGLIARVPTKGHDAEREAEKFRQLYVALTRAKERLYVPIVCGTVGNVPEEGAASSMELFLSHFLYGQPLYENMRKVKEEDLISLLDDLELNYTRLYPSSYSPQSENLLEGSFIPPPKFSPPKHDTVSFSSLRAHASFSPVPQEKGVSSSRLPLGAETGTLLHALLEKQLKKRSQGVEKLSLDLLPQTYHPFHAEIEELVCQALCTPMFPGGPSAQELSWKEKRVEVAFAFREGKILYRGVIDLLFFYEGKWYLVDWKSHAPPEGLPSPYGSYLIEYALAQGYEKQGAMYEKAVKKYLRRSSSREEIGGVFFIFFRSGPTVLSYSKDHPSFFVTLENFRGKK